MKTLLLHIVVFAYRLLYRLFCLFPRKQQIVFLSRQTNEPSLEFKLLMDELDRNMPSTRVCALCKRNERTLASNIASGFFSLKQLFAVTTSKVVVVDSYNPAVCIPRLQRNTKVVQLWHALGAFKKFSYQIVGQPGGRSEASARILRMHKNYDVIISSGAKTAQALSSAFRCPPERFACVGLPRADYLLSPELSQCRLAKNEQLLAAYPQLDCAEAVNVLYAPTLRTGAEEPLATQYAHEVAAAFADVPNVNLIYAGHPLMEQTPSDNGLLFTGYDTIDLLECADYVITDYSSLVYDAALLHKKILFFCPDIETYRIGTGFITDFAARHKELACGDAGELPALLDAPQSSFDALCDDLNSFTDACTPGATKRIVHVIEELMG